MESASRLQIRPLEAPHAICRAVAAEVLHDVVVLDLSAQYDTTHASAGAVTTGACLVAVFAVSLAFVNMTGAAGSTPE